MAKLPCRVSSLFSTLILISCLGLSNFVLAQLDDLINCEIGAAETVADLYSSIIMNDPSNILDGVDSMKWCPVWAGFCSYIYRNCPTLLTCQFTNYDPSITSNYDPGSPTSYRNFLNCNSCNVEVSGMDFSFFGSGIGVPTHGGGGSGSSGGSGGVSSLSGVLAPDESPSDTLVENSAATSSTGAVTAGLVVGGIVGSLVAAKTSAAGAAGLLAGAGAGAAAPITNPKTGSGSTKSVIDAVTLLLHFQSVSTSGLLSISYPAIYRFFTYNFAWANLIIAADPFKDIVRRIGTDTSCLSDLGSLNLALVQDPRAPSGISVVATRYDLGSTTIGGLVYLSAIIGVAVALAVFVLVAVILYVLKTLFRNSTKLQSFAETWPSKASSMSLRLFIWVLGSVATFAIYQFVDPCSGPSLLAFASVEFACIILTLLVVSIFVIKIAKTQGPDALFAVSESEESKYSRKWGSLYAKLKRTLYWYFIPDYVWVLAKSIVVGVGQGSGLAQVSALTGVELVILLALLVARPYGTVSGNAFHISSSFKRLFASASLFAFWDGFSVPTYARRTLGIVLIAVESAYAVAIFIVMLVNGGSAIVKWNNERKERQKRIPSSPSETSPMTTTTTSPLVSHLQHRDSYFNSSLQEDYPPASVTGPFSPQLHHTNMNINNNMNTAPYQETYPPAIVTNPVASHPLYTNTGSWQEAYPSATVTSPVAPHLPQANSYYNNLNASPYEAYPQAIMTSPVVPHLYHANSYPNNYLGQPYRNIPEV